MLLSCIMGNVFGASRILETKSQDISASAASIFETKCVCSSQLLMNSVLIYLANTLTPRVGELSASYSLILTSHDSNASNRLGTTFSHDNNESKFTQKFFTKSQPDHLIYLHVIFYYIHKKVNPIKPSCESEQFGCNTEKVDPNSCPWMLFRLCG